MSIPLQSSDPAAGQALPLGPTSPVTGLVSYGWIGESWRPFSAQMGAWIVAILLLFVPVFVAVIAFYAVLWTTIFPHGFVAPAPAPLPTANGLPTTPLSPGPGSAQINALMASLLPMELGFAGVYSLWSAFLYGGMFRLAVRQVRGVPVELKDIFRGGSLFGRMLGAIFLLGLGGYGLEALCFGPLFLLNWRHGSALAVGLALAYRDMVGMPNMAPLPGPSYAPADAGVWPPPPLAPFPFVSPAETLKNSDERN